MCRQEWWKKTGIYMFCVPVKKAGRARKRLAHCIKSIFRTIKLQMNLNLEREFTRLIWMWKTIKFITPSETIFIKLRQPILKTREPHLLPQAATGFKSYTASMSWTAGFMQQTQRISKATEKFLFIR